MTTELKRKSVHISMAVFALLVGRLPPWAIAACCAFAFLFNLFLLPNLTARGLEREQDRARGFPLGILIYPAILLLLSLVFFENQVFMALAWAVMAFGDGFAGIAGKAIGGPRIPWNREKTWAGILGFVLAGGPLTLLWLYLLPEPARLGIPFHIWIGAVGAAVSIASLVETVKGTIDDNLAVPTTAALVAFVVTQVPALPPVPDQWALGLVLVFILTAFSIGSGKIDIPGGLVGGLLAWFIFLGGGLWGMGLLFLFFVLGTLASHWKKREKTALGLAQENRGKRSVRHAISNGGVAAICGLLAWLFPDRAALFQVMLAASLASATADTLSSELGNVYGKRFINILTLKPDTRGLDGVISTEGSMLGAAGSLLVAGVFAVAHTPQAGVLVGIAGMVGNLVDSLLGASLQRKGYMTNDTVNFANTLAASLFLWCCWLLFPA